MTISYNQLSPQARVWVYMANRTLDHAETTQIQQLLDQFVAQWTVHGEPIAGYAQVCHRAFIVLMTDAPLSGCSIDSSVRVLKTIEQQCGLRLFDRLNIAYRLADDETLYIGSTEQLRQRLTQGILPDAVKVFDNLVASKAEWESNWEIPLLRSRFACLLPNASSATVL